MRLSIPSLLDEAKNFVLLGEAGCGKSELGISFALACAKADGREVHFFDLDMTKPLFRSRDARRLITEGGVIFHAEQQFMDAPTQVGGVEMSLRDPGRIVIMDVGGDYIGARAIGGYAGILNNPDTLALYIVNAYRPWSDNIDHIDETLGKILGMSHVELSRLCIVSNPNNGITTTPEEFIEGHQKTKEILAPYIEVRFASVKEDIIEDVEDAIDEPVFSIRPALTYFWLKEDL